MVSFSVTSLCSVSLPLNTNLLTLVNHASPPPFLSCFLLLISGKGLMLSTLMKIALFNLYIFIEYLSHSDGVCVHAHTLVCSDRESCVVCLLVSLFVCTCVCLHVCVCWAEEEGHGVIRLPPRLSAID